MALSISIPIKDPDTVIDGTPVPGNDSGVVATYFLPTFLGINFNRNGTLKVANVSLEGYVNNTAKKSVLPLNVQIPINAAQTAQIWAIIHNKVKALPQFSAATEVADPA